MKNKVFLILGGTGSVGSAIGDIVEKEGAIVCRHGFDAGDYQADLSKDGEAKKLIEKIIKDRGHLEGIINSISAPVKIAPLEKKTWQDFEKHLSVQLKAGVDVILSALPSFKKQGGDIINILTNYVVGDPPASLSDYVTAKYAVLGFTKSLLKDLGKYHIRVNAVSPSFIRNQFTKDIPEKLDELLAAQSSLGRLTTVEDVAKAVLDLLQKGETGKHIIIDGGYVEINSL